MFQKCGGTLHILTEKRNDFEKFGQKMEAAQREAEFPGKGKQISITNNDGNNSYCRLYCEMVDAIQ
jgi:hypothetical protein